MPTSTQKARPTRRKRTGQKAGASARRRQRGATRGKIDPRDPRLLALLRSLDPRRELATRYALRGMFLANIGADRAFSARINELRKQLRLADKGFAEVLQEADAIGHSMLAEMTGTGRSEEDAAPIRSSARPIVAGSTGHLLALDRLTAFASTARGSTPAAAEIACPGRSLSLIG
jgi:hypothetical protein